MLNVSSMAEISGAEWMSILGPSQTSTTAMVGSFMWAQAQLVLTMSYLIFSPPSALEFPVYLGVPRLYCSHLAPKYRRVNTSQTAFYQRRVGAVHTYLPSCPSDGQFWRPVYLLELSVSCPQQLRGWHCPLFLTFSLSFSHSPCSLLLPGNISAITTCIQVTNCLRPCFWGPSRWPKTLELPFHVRVTSNLWSEVVRIMKNWHL